MEKKKVELIDRKHYVRKTSIAAYRAIQANGLLSRSMMEVYDLLYQSGPMTGTEIDAHFKGMCHHHKRLSELRDCGAIWDEDKIGKAICRITGQEAGLWDVTDRIPTKYRRVSAAPKRLEMKAAVLELQRRCNEAEADPFGDELSVVCRWLARKIGKEWKERR